MKDDLARDKGLEKLVAARLRARSQGGSAAGDRGSRCLDAETVAAYVDGRLAPGELKNAEAHLADCLRCQELIAELVRLAEADEPAKQLAAAARAPRFGWFRVAWAAPALVAVIVAGLWYTKEFHWPGRQTQEVALKVSPPSQPPAPPPALEEKSAATAGAARRVANEAQQSGKDMARSGPRSVSPPPAADAAKIRTEIANLTAMQNAPAPEASAATQPVMTRAVGAIAPPSERARLAGTAAAPATGLTAGVTSKAPTTPESATAATPAASTESARLVRKRKSLALEKTPASAVAAKSALPSAALFELRQVPISGQRQWRVGAQGLIEKPERDDSWQPVPSGVTSDLNAITFPAPSVGWVVGQAGTVLRSTDGGDTWVKVAIPTSEDLVGLRATSDQAVAVVTRSGKTFSTVDGGKTWKQL